MIISNSIGLVQTLGLVDYRTMALLYGENAGLVRSGRFIY